MTSEKNNGQIITFYSYKGGTGRSMALSNTACLLAERPTLDNKRQVLMIDWDLEAPGLHRYFEHFLPKKGAPGYDFNHTSELGLGLIDLFCELNSRIDKSISSNSAHFVAPDASAQIQGSESLARQILEEINLERFVTPTDIPGLDLMQAGNLSIENADAYSEKVNTFDWEGLYNKAPHLIRLFAETLASKYSFVLIDSRTGVTDVSGICTTLLPEKLVVVFTPNTQSLEGAINLVNHATDYRKESADLRPLMIYPLVSRVASEQPDLRNAWRFGNEDDGISGFQNEFEKVLAKVYGRKKISLEKYFDEVQIQHLSQYAYGEKIAVKIDQSEDRFSLRRSYETFVTRLIKVGVPWDEIPEAVNKPVCFVIMGFGRKIDLATGRILDLDKSYQLLIKPAVEKAGLVCRRADEFLASGSIENVFYRQLLTADIVIADLSTSLSSTYYELGVRHALRPDSTIIIAEELVQAVPFDLLHTTILRYSHLGEGIDFFEATRFQAALTDKIHSLISKPEIDSPVYTFINDLIPPKLKVTKSN